MFNPPQIQPPPKSPEKKCRKCPTGGYMVKIRVPYVFKYLLAEFASVNLSVTANFDMSEFDSLYHEYKI